MTHKLSDILKILFQRVSIERILKSEENGKIFYDDFDLNYLQDLLMTYDQQFSDTESNLQIQEVQGEIKNNMLNSNVINRRGTFNVFSILFFYVTDVLVFHENKVVCKYKALLEWNELARAIGEDLPVLAMQVKKDLEQGKVCENFAWPPVIGHNNDQLDRILERGMADNHFHLRGSSTYFSISWMNLMNNPGKTQFWSAFEKIEANYRDKHKKAEIQIEKQTLKTLTLKAVLIRLYLCSRLACFSIRLEDYCFNIDKTFCGARENGKYKDENETWEKVRMLLEDSFFIKLAATQIQTVIDTISYANNVIDYMLQFAPDRYLDNEEEFWILSGERWFIYSMLEKIRTDDKMFSREEYNLFYAYLRIKNELRCELLQVNNIVGFENFQIYQSRKELFSHIYDYKSSEKMLARLAVRDVLLNPSVKFLEVRISPANTAYDNMINIREYDKAIVRKLNRNEEFNDLFMELLNYKLPKYRTDIAGEENLLNKFYYVLHFTKKCDVLDDELEVLECRHYAYRKGIRKKAEEILKFRKDYPQYGRRIIGIDACSQEIGCRPEVFGRVFRTLKNYVYPYPDTLDKRELPQLKITYHVGEDFLDVTDGLRAIDEAIRFLNMDCGDRLGHAIALGINVKKWYDFKKRQVTLSLQDYLDNVVWLHHALIKYKIKDMSSLKGWLEEKYSYYFAWIYQPYIREIRDGLLSKESDNFCGSFDINTYYLSWLLRGDQPSLYKSGRLQRKLHYLDQWDRCAVNRENARSDDIRNIPEVTLMYYMYHYNKEARIKGSEKKTFHISDIYIQGVCAVQKAMREEVAERGIAIETNPSSNLRIGILESYDEHPIKTFYNYGLTKDVNELMECPQMNVSINTDDKGVFSTRLENEYALLACAFERKVDSEGKPMYKKEFIYEWLNNIRKMGIRQTFISNDK